MQIILDITRIVRQSIKGVTLTGIDRVSFAYVKHYQNKAYALMRISGKNIILKLGALQEILQWIENPTSKTALRYIIIKNMLINTNKKHIFGAFLINTGHIGHSQKTYKKMIQKLNLKPIFFVHDLIPINYPEHCAPGEKIRHQNKINLVLDLSYGIITNSKATLIDLKEYAHTRNKLMPNATIAHLAPGNKISKPGPKPIDKPYFVILSTIESRKNHLLLLQIWRDLVTKFNAENVPILVIIGKRGWECEQAIDLLDRCEKLKNVVIEIPKCCDQDLVTYIYHSKALLFPSFAEGYGLPLIESLSIGAPVIASDLSVFQELALDIPEYINPLDAIKWQDTIIEYSKPNSIARNLQLERMKKFTTPNWAKHFSTVDCFLLNKWLV